MANQRKSDKKKIGVWVTPSEEAGIKAALAKLGFDNLADYLRSLADQQTAPPPKSKSTGGKGKPSAE